MRHLVFGKKLSRDINSRKALLNNLASSLFRDGKVTTTIAKAKFARPYAEHLITGAKRERLHLKRQLASRLEKVAFKKLTGEIVPGFSKRQGGYTRIVQISKRQGDGAQMARLELVQLEKSSTIVSKSQKPQKLVAKSKEKSKGGVVAKKPLRLAKSKKKIKGKKVKK